MKKHTIACGFLLIEAMASLAIVGTLSLMIACYAWHITQLHHRAYHYLQAVTLAHNSIHELQLGVAKIRDGSSRDGLFSLQWNVKPVQIKAIGLPPQCTTLFAKDQVLVTTHVSWPSLIGKDTIIAITWLPGSPPTS